MRDADSAGVPGRVPRAGGALRHSAFRLLLAVQFANAVAVWIHVVSVQWILTARDESATVVSMAPAAMSIPFLVLALPIGVIAGFASRKRMMAAATSVSGIAAVSTAVLTGLGRDGVIPTLGSVVIVGSALAVVGVSWQSLLPETVDRQEIPGAALLDGAAFNVARAVGPLIAGFTLGILGAASTFAISGSVLLLCSAVLWFSEVRARDRTSPRTPVLPEISGAMRFIVHSPWTLRLLFQVTLFGIPSSALWALLPLAVHDRIGLESDGFGLMMALVGAGGLVALGVVGRLRRRFSNGVVAASGAVLFASAIAAVAVSRSPVVVGGMLILGGVAWVGAQSTWMTMGHQSFPDWIRARLMSVMLLLFQAIQAIGSLIWGVLSDSLGLEVALLIAAGLMVVSAAALLTWGLGSNADDEPASRKATEQDTAHEFAENDGPVTVRHEYVVSAAELEPFLGATRELRRSRLRTGASRWSLTRDPMDPRRFVEAYAVASVREFRLQESARLTGYERGVRTRVMEHADRASGPVLSEG